MKTIVIVAMSLMSYSLFAFECKMETTFYAEPCRPFNKPWASPDAKICTPYASGIAIVKGELDQKGFGHAEIDFEGNIYEMDCFPNQTDGKHSDCLGSRNSKFKAQFASRYNGESISFEDEKGTSYSSGLNHCKF